VAYGPLDLGCAGGYRMTYCVSPAIEIFAVAGNPHRCTDLRKPSTSAPVEAVQAKA
jgi:hypothetical protein